MNIEQYLVPGVGNSGSGVSALASSYQRKKSHCIYPGLLFVSFNQDSSCFSVGLEDGFKICNTDPLKQRMHKIFEDGGIGIVEMLFRTNYLGLVGGGKNPRWPSSKVFIWDDRKNMHMIELEFRSQVKALKLRRDRIVVVLANKVHVYAFSPDPQKLYVFETCDNLKGVVALCTSNNNALVAFPGRQRGHIQLVDLADPKKTSSIIPAHNSTLSCLAFNLEGTKIASASERGTLIRIYDTETGKQLHELRRGSDKAEVYCIAFSPDSSRLVVSSDTGTLHVFNLQMQSNNSSQTTSKRMQSSSDEDLLKSSIDDENTNNLQDENGSCSSPFNATVANTQQQQQQQQMTSASSSSVTAFGNRKSALSVLAPLLPSYFSSSWSFASYKLPEAIPAVVAFSPNCNNNIIAITADGRWWKLGFDAVRGGEIVKESVGYFVGEESGELQRS